MSSYRADRVQYVIEDDELISLWPLVVESLHESGEGTASTKAAA